MPPTDQTSPHSLAELAHELRAPLGGIDAMVELLEASGLDDDQTRIVDALKASHTHLRAIANRILGGADARVAAARVGVGETGQAYAEFLAAFLPTIEARCRARGIRFVLADEVGIGSLPVKDAVGLRQVLENLCDNATRLTASGSVTLTIAKDDASRLAFMVDDTGPGLSEADAARLIRDGGKLAGRAGGAGLGLSIAGRIVAAHGGVLSGGPAPGGAGARFRFTWPTDAVGHETTDCLIVDDHPASRLVMGTILKAAGFRCMEVPDPASALAAVQAYAPRIVLTDINMPNGDGRALARSIRDEGASDGTVVIAVSAEEIDLDAPENAVFSGAVLKPITVRSVLDAVRQVPVRRRDRAA